jgi:hypothetical protein
VVESSVAEVARVVWLADRFAEPFVEEHPQWMPTDVCRMCVEQFNVKGLDCQKIFTNVAVRVKALAEQFEIPLEGSRGIEPVLQLNSSGDRDKRRSLRQSRSGVIAIFPYQEGSVSAPLRATFRDASQHGLGVTLGCPLGPGERFAVRLPRKGGGVLPLLYQVVRCEQIGDSEFRIGAELVSVMREGSVAAPQQAQPVAGVETGIEDGRPAGDAERIRSAILASQ